jgi:hypothetical protein
MSTLPPVAPVAPASVPQPATTLPLDTNGIPVGGYDTLTDQLKIEILDGQHVTIGALADTPATDDTGAWSLQALMKRLIQRFPLAGVPQSVTQAGSGISSTATTPTTILTAMETGPRRRGFVIGSSLTQVVTITIWLQTGAASPVNVAAYNTLFTMAAGNTTHQLVLVTSAGIKPLGITAGTLSTAPTLTTDGSAQLDAPLTSLIIKASVAAGATGNLWIDYSPM